MNINNLSRGHILQRAVDLVSDALIEMVEEGDYISAIVTSSTLRKNENSYIGARILLRESGDIVDKNVAFSVNANGNIYSAIPITALCNLNHN